MNGRGKIMSYTTYTQARLDRKSSSRTSEPRYALRAPERQVAFRKDYIAEIKTSLVLRPCGSASSEVGYTITYEDGTPAFTATGRKYNGRSCRELRDASGLPLYDLNAKPLAHPLGWLLTLPGSKTDESIIAKATPSLGWGSVHLNFSFQNGAAIDCKNEEDKKVKLSVKKHGEALAFFDVVDGNRRIADVRESITHNEKLALMRSSRRGGHRPALDLIIAPGVDMSLVRSPNAL